MSERAAVTSPPGAASGAERLALDLLCALLQREHDALMSRDAELVASIATEKHLLLDQVSLLLKARPPRTSGRTRSAALAPCDPTLRSTLKRAEAQNRINASVLELHASVVTRALGVMRQAVGTDGPYNARGKLAGHYLAS